MPRDVAKLERPAPAREAAPPLDETRPDSAETSAFDRRVDVVELPRTTKAPARASKNAPARFILIAWGSAYVERLLDLTLPAALAPGNLPALVKDFNCDVTIVTESRFFDYIARHRTTKRLRRSCRVRLVSMDDILFPGMYGWTITLANFRGFEDLGKRMTETFLIFTFADFILADGSFASLAERMKAGHRLIMAPSYRVLEHKVEPILRSRFDFDKWQISVPHREMADIILKNKHYCIEAKTINQRLYYMDLFEQFYWQVDPETMICRQAPFALVCMMPETVVTEIETFWDYGILEAACPETRICALQDSDEFLMLELQEESAQHELVRIGWPTEEYIAQRFRFTTNDHRTLGQFTLYLHSRDLPPETAEAEKHLGEFVDRIFRLAGAPMPAPKHEYWCGQINMYRQFTQQRHMIENHLDHENILRAPFVGGNRTHPHAGSPTIRQAIYNRIVGVPPYVSRLHIMRADFRKALEFLHEAVAGRPQTDALIVMTRSDEGYIGSRFFMSVNGKHLRCAASTVVSKWLPSEFFGGRKFDVCLCEIEHQAGEPHDFKDLYAQIRPYMHKGSPIIFFSPLGARPLNEPLFFARFSCPSIDSSEIWFAGSALRKRIFRWKASADLVHERQRRLGWLAKAIVAVAAIPFILLDNLMGSSKPSQTFDQNSTSITMRVRVQ